MNQLISIKLKRNEAPSEELLLNTLGVELISKTGNDKLQKLPCHLNKVIINMAQFNVRPELLKDCKSLKYLRITGANCPLLKLPHLLQLKTLIVSKSNVETLDKSIYKLSELEVLDLSGNKITQLLPLANLPKLKRINLDGNNLSDLPDWLFQLKNINHLSLDENPLNEQTKQKLYDHFKIIF